jgi:hypothetical protein
MGGIAGMRCSRGPALGSFNLHDLVGVFGFRQVRPVNRFGCVPGGYDGPHEMPLRHILPPFGLRTVAEDASD